MLTELGTLRRVQLFFFFVLAASHGGFPCFGGGVTVITHGYNSDVNGWVTAMADALPDYVTFPGTNLTTYKIALTTDGNGNYFYQSSRTNGVAPGGSDSGEIIVKLDWSQMSGGLSTYDISTYDVAWVAAWVLMQTNTITELGGHALAEFPLHLVGHSRGGSLVNEISRILGTNGIWVDHLTTLDPHPLNNDGNVDLFFPTDASASETYANVLYRDNYWQDFPGGFLDFNGEAASGAYNRHLTDLSGGYNSTAFAAPYHSNVHLWYQGTISWGTPTSDGDATITSSERRAWWTGNEESGTNAGFEFSLIGGGDRVRPDQPLGPGFSAINDGYNQMWNLGGGTSNNRTALSVNNGQWPSIIRFDLTGTNVVHSGDPVPIQFYYQYGGSLSEAACQIYFDSDANPDNANEVLALAGSLTNTGINSVFVVSLSLNTSDVAPGIYRVLTKINAGRLSRVLYAPQLIGIMPTRVPTLDIATLSSTQILVGVNAATGQRIAIQTSPDLRNWSPVITNTLTSNRWTYTNTPPANVALLFYRAVIAQ